MFFRFSQIVMILSWQLGSIIGQNIAPSLQHWIATDNTTGIENETISFILGLKIRFDNQFIDSLHNPNSTNFRKFQTLNESRLAATAGLDPCRTILLTKATELGLVATNMTPYGDYYEINGTVGQALNIFQNGTIDFNRFISPNVTQKTIIRGIVSGEYDLVSRIANESLRTCIGLIGRLIDFPVTRRFHTRKSVTNTSTTRDLSSSCSTGNRYNQDTIVPATLNSMYNLPSTPSGNASSFGAIQAVYESTSVTVSQSDLTCFVDSFELASSSIEDSSSYETSSCGNGCDEPNLDTQYLSSMNQDIDVTYLAYESMSDMVVALSSTPDSQLPFVVSISWGLAESQQEYSSLTQLCQEMGTISGRGLTFFASSGDQGATNSQPCGNNYNVNFPASCVYVTAVGATTGYSPGSEVVATSPAATITSGGGFSTIFTTSNGFNLDFQQSFTSQYLTTPAAQGSASGFPKQGSRGVPDIAAPGTNYVVMIDSVATGLDGTSCSSPVMAGITARIMVNNGGVRFGCINQVLYANPNIFFDVVSGQNSGDGQQQTCQGNGGIMGFEATTGWDPASGLGTLGTSPVGAFSQYQEILLNNPITPNPSATSKRSMDMIVYATTLLSIFLLSFVH